MRRDSAGPRAAEEVEGEEGEEEEEEEDGIEEGEEEAVVMSIDNWVRRVSERWFAFHTTPRHGACEEKGTVVIAWTASRSCHPRRVW